ncbi:hypothetical protein [Streptomyces bluensis]|uniref:Uncharacterized protein n=1 Tax=Streptomyces bluensis TaxID=33897 RepID=A0ABW6URU7_9ACTN
MVGLVVSWRGDRRASLPENNRLAFSYLIPVDRVAEPSPETKELSSPHAWDHGFEERLVRWFDDPDCGPVRAAPHLPVGGRVSAGTPSIAARSRQRCGHEGG